MNDKYSYSVMWSDEDQAHIGRVMEFPSLAAHGDTPEAALREIRLVVTAVIKDLEESGEHIPEPLGMRHYSGRFNLRIPPALHQRLAMEALHRHTSLNALITQKLSQAG
jgi:predicted HicB family RNase H-like nuclease